MDLISIIIPAYNVECYISICINSILSQTYNNFEVIIINDGSTDKTGEICKKYALKDSRIKLFYQENKGVSAARNFGIEKASGNYIIFIDADDFLEDNMIKIMYDNINKYKCDIFICNYNIIDTNGIKNNLNHSEKVILELTAQDYKQKLYEHDSYRGYLWNKLIKKDVMDTIRFDENIHIMEDLIFLDKISKNVKKAYYINDLYLYNYVQRYSSALNNKFSKKHRTVLDAYKIILNNIKMLNSDLQNKYKFDYVFEAMNIYYLLYIQKELDILKRTELIRIRQKYLKEAMQTSYCNCIKKIKLIIISYFPIIYGNIKKIIKERRQKNEKSRNINDK